MLPRRTPPLVSGTKIRIPLAPGHVLPAGFTGLPTPAAAAPGGVATPPGVEGALGGVATHPGVEGALGGVATPPGVHLAASAPPPVEDAFPAAGASQGTTIRPAVILKCFKGGTTEDACSVQFGCVQPTFTYGETYKELGAEESPLQQGSDVAGPSTPPPTRAKKPWSKSSRKTRSRSPSPEPTGPAPATQQDSWYGFGYEHSKWAKEDEEVKNHKAGFKSYLEESCIGIADQLWVAKSYHIRIDYDDLKKKNKALAHFIANNLNKFHSSLKSIAKDFLIDRFRTKRNDGIHGFQHMAAKVQRSIMLAFTGIPISICSLGEFISQNKTEPSYLFKDHPDCRHKIASIKPLMRRVTQKMVAYITSSHKEGKAWDGNWDLEDWEIVNGSTVRPCKEPMKLGGREMSRRDLTAISKKVISKLSDTGDATGTFPAFFSHLSVELLTIGTEEMSDKDFYGWFYSYLKFHPALMSSKARSGLLYRFYYSAVRLNYNQDEDYVIIFKDGSLHEWPNFVSNDWSSIPEVQWRVFWHNKYPVPGTTRDDWKPPYNGTLGNLLIFIRQILEHSNRHTYWYSVQTMISSTEPELLAADCFPTFLPDFIKLFFQHDLMMGDFSEDWDFYTKSSGYEGV